MALLNIICCVILFVSLHAALSKGPVVIGRVVMRNRNIGKIGDKFRFSSSSQLRMSFCQVNTTIFKSGFYVYRFFEVHFQNFFRKMLKKAYTKSFLGYSLVRKGLRHRLFPENLSKKFQQSHFLTVKVVAVYFLIIVSQLSGEVQKRKGSFSNFM